MADPMINILNKRQGGQQEFCYSAEEIAKLDSFSMRATLIYMACQDGQLDLLKELVAKYSPEEVQKTLATKWSRVTPLLAAVRNCGTMQAPHLMCDSCDIVEYLVKECGADVEQTGSVELFDGDEIHNAPPLWCSAAVGCLRCVRLLVEAGANVNATTSTNSTPLRAACFDGHFAIVKYLVERGADMEIANQHGHTCLMISCYKKHPQIAAYLLDRGAQVNRQSVKGNTAMHDAAEANSMEILKLLVRNGATLLRDCYNLTPLMTAALTGNDDMVEYLQEVYQCPPEEEADAYKLLGATYVDKFHCHNAAYDIWREALEKASKIEDQAAYKNLLLKSSPAVSEAYGEGAREFATEADLQELQDDYDKMRSQSLILRERILGLAHPETFYFVRFQGAAFAEGHDYHRCLALWMYHLERQRATLKPFSDMTHSLYLSILEIFRLLTRVADPTKSVIPISDVFRLLKLAIGELLHPQNDFLLFHNDCDNDNNNNNDEDDENTSSNSSNNSARTKKYCMKLTRKLPALRARRRRRGSCAENEAAEENGDEDSPAAEEQGNHHRRSSNRAMSTFNAGNIVDRHFLLIIQLIGLMVQLRPQMMPAIWRSIQQVLYAFVRLEPRSATSYTLLHILTLISVTDLPVPLLPIAPMGDLFEVVATVSRRLDVIDLEGNTALHLIFRDMGLQQQKLKLSKNKENEKGDEKNKKFLSRTLQLRRNMAEQLLTRGAHLDLVNEEGRSPLDYVDGPSLGNYYKVNFLSLACRAASVVVAARLPLDGLSGDLRAFVQMHQPKGFSANVYEDVLEEEEEGEEEEEEEEEEVDKDAQLLLN